MLNLISESHLTRSKSPLHPGNGGGLPARVGSAARTGFNPKTGDPVPVVGFLPLRKFFLGEETAVTGFPHADCPAANRDHHRSFSPSAPPFQTGSRKNSCRGSPSRPRQEGFDQHRKIAHIDRLRHISVAAALHHLLRISWHRIRGDGDDRDVTCARRRFQHAGHFEPGNIRQSNIQRSDGVLFFLLVVPA